ncbi:hypothetical protein N658DRAFT_487945 [Parathielavia hyrcaniae]|uniref:Uncharacterized protein n=1 Tax=Parathielavia hyrcaniae TaxID=113614 RepID=A0AAN6T032_9PEZI|nr:hypothetical protein N658DRAFT_487945 [Parathielavia hyrcaniae]
MALRGPSDLPRLRVLTVCHTRSTYTTLFAASQTLTLILRPDVSLRHPTSLLAQGLAAGKVPREAILRCNNLAIQDGGGSWMLSVAIRQMMLGGHKGIEACNRLVKTEVPVVQRIDGLSGRTAKLPWPPAYTLPVDAMAGGAARKLDWTAADSRLEGWALQHGAKTFPSPLVSKCSNLNINLSSEVTAVVILQRVVHLPKRAAIHDAETICGEDVRLGKPAKFL